jgi:hypothetical protein
VNIHRLPVIVATTCMQLVAVFATVSGLHYSWRIVTRLPRPAAPVAGNRLPPP